MQPHPCSFSRGSRRRLASVLKLFEKVLLVVSGDCRRRRRRRRWRQSRSRRERERRVARWIIPLLRLRLQFFLLFAIGGAAVVGRRRRVVHLGHDPRLHHADRRPPPRGRGGPLGILGLRVARDSLFFDFNYNSVNQPYPSGPKDFVRVDQGLLYISSN